MMPENLLRDIRYAVRVLRKSPLFTAVALVTLALGIGTNVAVLGVLNAVLFQPLAVTAPENLYQLRHQQWMQGRLLTTSYPALEDFRRRNASFTGMAGIYAYSNAALTWKGTAVSVSGQEVTGNYFDLLGVHAARGRLFHPDDEHGPGSAPYLVLSDALWRNLFHADASVIGAAVEMNRHPFTIIGVAPREFHGTERFVWPDYWIPMVNEEQLEAWDYLHSRTSIGVTVIARLKPGVTPRQATENLNAIAAGLAKEHPESDDGQPLRLVHPGLYGDEGDVIRGFLWSVALLALLVLAAACANLATLFAARAADRARELALRVALGSSRPRLVRQLLTEAVIVSLMGGAAGLAGAFLLLRALDRWRPPLGHLDIAVDARVYLAGLLLSAGSALVFGMAPLRQVWRSSPLAMMKGGPVSYAFRRFAPRDLLLGAQIAICTLLVTASLVAVRGLDRALHAPLGFQPQGAILVDIDTRQTGDLTVEKRKALIEAARGIPGVTAAGTVSRTPMTGGLHGIPIFPPGATEFKLRNAALAPYVFTMSPGFFEAAVTRLAAGRDVSWHDTANTPHVAVVNQTLARKMWGRSPAIGQRFVLWGSLTEVVGVVEDGKYHDLAEAPQPVVYVPLAQSEQSDAILVVRSKRAQSEMGAALTRTISAIVPNAPISVESWTHSMADEFFPARAATLALGVMGAMGAMLAVTGIFGMAAYAVSRRMRELGIRVALGARKPHVIQAAVGRPMVLLAAGSALGLFAGILASGLLQKIVYRADPLDPLVLGGAVATMILLGLLASAIPARRALGADPSQLMRED